MNQKDSIPNKYVNSKVAINIDADREYYDVLFNQDKISTDLTIRKTLKDMCSQKNKRADECSPSLENVLCLPDCTVEKRWLSPGSKSPTSIALYNNQSDDESPLVKHVSRLTIRDSLEISHRREDKSNHNIKNTQTCFTAQFSNNAPDETEFLAPIKHYTGDDCSICDPIARDKQIRELLGVEKSKNIYAKQAHNCEHDDRFPYQCIYRQECKKSQVTEINFQFQNLRPCFKSIHHNKDKSAQYAYRHRSVQCRYTGCPGANFNDYSCAGGCTNNDNGTYEFDSKCCLRPVGLDSAQSLRCDKDSCYARYHNYDSYNDDEVNQSKYIGGDEQDDPRYASEEKSALYQQLILNRNIQVFLQVDQFSKQKPIILSRKQYNKVKKTIQKTISKKKSYHDKRKKPVCDKGDSSDVSVGEVRPKMAKDPKSLHEKEAQTDLVPCCSRDNCKSRKRDKKSKTRKTKSNTKHDLSDQTGDHTERHRSRSQKKGQSSDHKPKLKADQNMEYYDIDHSGHSSWSSNENKTNGDRNEEPKAERTTGTRHTEQKGYQNPERPSEHKGSRNPERHTEQKGSRIPERNSEQKVSRSPDRHSEQKESRGPEKNEEQRRRQDKNDVNQDINQGMAIDEKEKEVKTLILFNADSKRNSRDTDNEAHTRKTMSSVEIRYASIAFMKQVAYSSTDVGALSDSSLTHVNSFHTIFKGHRKSPTPNLGTSAYSLYSEEVLNSENKSTKFVMEQRDSKPKKPFLRRLMSCLVMRSTRESELKLPTGPTPEVPSVNSSIDSYHISTSLGAVEVSSSIYDTSASFYSNHSILPVNSKIKRGFFSSVRGFLTNRKS